MNWIKRVMERGQPPVAAPYATTPNGAPFPLRSWPPDTAIDIQNLANWVDPFAPYAKKITGAMTLAAQINNIVQNVPTKLTNMTPSLLTGGMTYASGALTIPVAGMYILCVSSAWDSSTAYGCESGWGTSAVSSGWSPVNFIPTGGRYGGNNIAAVITCTASQTVALWVKNNVPNIPLTTAALTLTYIGP